MKIVLTCVCIHSHCVYVNQSVETTSKQKYKLTQWHTDITTILQM